METLCVATLDKRNRITLSKEVLAALKVESGDKVSIEKNDGNIIMHKAYFLVRRKKSNGEGKLTLQRGKTL